MEFKERLLQQGYAGNPGINRNIMEFKGDWRIIKMKKGLELIET